MYSGKFEWPGGAYIAFVLNMCWESFPDDLASSTSSQNGRKTPASAPYGRAMRTVYEYAFAETGGIQRILDLYRRYEIQGSWYTNGQTVARFPDLAREVANQGHELLAEGWDHEYLFNLSGDEEAAALDRTVNVFSEVLGRPPAGFSNPGGHPTERTIRLVAEHGMKYMCGFRNSDMPFIIRTPEGSKIVGMTSYAFGDGAGAPGAEGQTPRQKAEMLRDYFDALYEEGRRGYPNMLTYGMHGFNGFAYRMPATEEVIQHIQRQEHVWIATREQIADWILTNYSEMDLEVLYPGCAATSDAHYGLGIGLGGEEAERKLSSFRK
jgi:peptidoglycan/xylan/chitin deacetylase (PgdA/CDA1 family)